MQELFPNSLTSKFPVSLLILSKFCSSSMDTYNREKKKKLATLSSMLEFKQSYSILKIEKPATGKEKRSDSIGCNKLNADDSKTTQDQSSQLICTCFLLLSCLFLKTNEPFKGPPLTTIKLKLRGRKPFSQ